MIVDKKKCFLKKLWLALMGDEFLEFRVECDVDGFGIRW